MLGCLEDHGLLRQIHGRADEAVHLLASAAATRERLRLPRSPRDQRKWENGIAASREALGEAAFDAAWEMGRTWEIERAVGCAISPVQSERKAA